MIKAIVFDMDGVLIEAKDWHYEALNKALRLFGYEISRFEHLTMFDGIPTRSKLERLTIEKGLPKKLHGFINEMKQQYTEEFIHSFCKPMFVHEYALNRLKAEGYRMGVASNSIRYTVELMMKKSCLANYLDFMISNEEVKNAKPDAEMYILAMSKLGLQPSECLIVEDNENGIKAARASGANVLVVNEVQDVNYENISSFITELNRK
jgi:beta-phosphoglucomutase